MENSDTQDLAQANTLLQQANVHFAKSEFSKALESIKSMELGKVPADKQPYFLEMEIRNLMALLRFEAALEMVNSCLKYMPNLRLFHLKKLQCLVSLGRDQEATTVIKELRAKLGSIDQENASEMKEQKDMEAIISDFESKYEQDKTRDLMEVRVCFKGENFLAGSQKSKYELLQKGIVFEQTDNELNVSILRKVKEGETPSVIFKPLNFEVAFEQRDGKPYFANIDLFAEILPEKSSFKVSEDGNSLQITMGKKAVDGDEWPSLTSEVIEADIGGNSAGLTNTKKHWSKYLDQYQEDEVRLRMMDDDPAMAMFKEIYKNGDEEKKRAMMKSYLESGGTVL